MSALSRSALSRSAVRFAPAGGLIIGYVLDQAFGDPRRWHPVAGFGQLASALETRVYADSRLRGVGFVAIAAGLPTVAGTVAAIGAKRWPALTMALTAATTWTVLGGRSLAKEAGMVADHLGADDLPAARQQVSRLVGRDISDQGASEIARATVESVAENSSDAVVAPLFWGAVAGLPGLVGYRAINTLDAMVGHRSARYAKFGWAAARLDDVANWVPARLTAGLAAAAAPWVAGSPKAAIRAAISDSGAHPSPNAGVVEAAYAGALGIQLGGTNTYEGVVSERGKLGQGRPCEGGDVPRTVRLAGAVGNGGLLLAVAIRLVRVAAPRLRRG